MKLRVTLIAALLATACLAHAAQDIRKIIDQAPVLAKAGRINDAAQLLLQVETLAGRTIIEKKTLAGVFQQIHTELLRRDDLGLLYKVDERARSLFSSEKQAGINFGEACVLRGNYDAAAKVLQEAAGQDSTWFPSGKADDARLHLLLAQACLVLNKLDEAAAAIEKAIAADPADAQNYYTKAQVMMRAGKWAEVATASALAFKLDPKLAQPVDYLVRASCYQRDEEYDQAQKVVEEALSRYPTAAGLHCSLGHVFQAKKQAAQAFYHFQYEIMLSGPRSSYTKEAKDQIEIMTALLTKEKEPDDYLKVAYGAAALMNMKPGGYEKAIDNIKKGLRANGDNCLPLQVLLGSALTALGNDEEAAKAYEAVLLIDPFFVPGYIDLGDAYERLGQKDKALEQYGKAMTLDKSNWRVMEMLDKVDHMPKQGVLRRE